MYDSIERDSEVLGWSVNVFLSFLLCDLSAESAACLSLCIGGNQKMPQIVKGLFGTDKNTTHWLCFSLCHCNSTKTFILQPSLFIHKKIQFALGCMLWKLWVFFHYFELLCNAHYWLVTAFHQQTPATPEAHTCFQESLMPLNSSLKVNIADSGLKIARGGETSTQSSPALHLCADAFFPTVSVL